MAFNFNWAPKKIPTQLKGQANLPEIEQPFDFNSYFTNLVNREEMEGYHPAQNFSVPNQQHGGNQAINYAGYSPTTPMTEEDVINQNMAERQAGNADDMANWIQQGGTPQADAVAAAQAQAEQEAAAKQEQIADIQSQIKALETRLAENKSKLQKWTGNANQIAAIEARKINSQDPTMIWRWKMGQDAAKQQRADDLKRIEAEKAKNEARNKEMNQYKIDAILKGAMPANARTRDELMMMEKSLNDAEELAKQYKDTDMLKRIDERRAVLHDHVPVAEKSNIIESDFIKESSMVGKVGGRSKKQFVEYVTGILEDPANEAVWRYNPGLQQKLYQAIGTNTKNTPKPTAPQEQ